MDPEGCKYPQSKARASARVLLQRRQIAFPPALMHSRSNFLRRIGRKLFWSSPALYRQFGLLRNRGDCFANDFDLWIDGYPRSANTFAVEAFTLANPTARIRSHRHIPTFIIQALKLRKPGIFLLRRPEDAAISWAIFWDDRLDRCLDYYIDFHKVLGRYAPQLFIATFEEVTTRFDSLIGEFNQQFGTQYATVPHDEKTVADCFVRIERDYPKVPGGVNEMRVCRPSEQRSPRQAKLREMLRNSPALVEKLARAEEYYRLFVNHETGFRRPQAKSLVASNQQMAS